MRTQYLLQNKTLFDYQVKIVSCFDKNSASVKHLKAGGCLPIPESYNQSVMQVKLGSNDHDSDWSDEWPVYALKKIVQVDQPGYLRHGLTHSFFRKEVAKHEETYDIVLMPPLVLQNCLPVDLQISFVDSNKKMQKISLTK